MIPVHSLAQWALRSSILILCGAVLLKALRVKDPSVRLAAWTATLVGSMLIPLLSISLPSMPVTIRPIAPQAPAYKPAPRPSTTILLPQDPADPTPKRFDWAHAAVDTYILVAGALLLRFALGLAMSLRLLHRSRPTSEPGIRESYRIASPVTLGIARPAIILPADWREWPAAKLAAVLAHERSHIRRRDPGIQALSAIHRALLWYSPLSWYLHRQIVSVAEEASDDDAIAAIRDRVSYAETLLEFMQRGVQLEHVRLSTLQGVPMARYGQPEQRVHRILDATTLSRGVTRWSIAAILALGLPLAYIIAAAQERLTFEAASVKPATPPPGVTVVGDAVSTDGVAFSLKRNTGGPGTEDPGRIDYPLITVTSLLKRAYQGYFEIKAPDWADSDIMAVGATMPPGATKEQFRTMLQNLLIDRFALKTHVETKEITGYALTLARDGPKFKESQPDNQPPGPVTDRKGPDGFPVPPAHMHGMMFQSMPNERARMIGPNMTMSELASTLGTLVDSTVEDATGLKAAYDITLTFAGHLGGLAGATSPSIDPAAPEPLPDLFSALQSQLGLKLERQKVSVEILVVDHIDKTPTGN